MNAPTEGELLDELRRSMGLCEAPPNAMTTAELQDVLGVSRTTVRDHIRKLHREGRLETYSVRRVDGTGRAQIVNAYVLLPARVASRVASRDTPSGSQREKQHRRPARKRS